MAETITKETIREGHKMNILHGPKKGKKLILLVVGNYFTPNLSNVACMQFVRSNNNGRSRIDITCQRNLLF
jgi:hypothetical protein